MDLDVIHAPGASHPDRLVGRLHEDLNGRIWFEYDADWRAGEIELSPIHLPLATRGAVTCPTRRFGPLFGLFDDALPDDWGIRLMRRYFADLGIPWNRVTPLQKLACQGNRKMGALVFQPVLEPSSAARAELTSDVTRLVEEAQAVAHGDAGAADLARLMLTGLSPGGARPKALLALSPDLAELRLEDPPPDGFDAWLLKFDVDPELHEGRIEHAYALMARAAGIDIPETRVLASGPGRRAHFLVRRFDRGPANRRIHLHSYSGLTHVPPGDPLDYSDLLDLTRALTRDQRAVEQLFRRAVFNVAAGNDDDHGRNHAFLMDPSGCWSLAPAYDLTPASHPLTAGVRAASVGGKLRDIRRGDFLALADRQAVRAPAAIIGEVLAALATWPDHAATAGLPKRIIAEVRGQMPGLPG